MLNDIKSEARQLPYMLGKIIGGIVCAIGVGGFIYSVTRPGNQLHAPLLLFVVAGIAGLILFIVCSRLSGKMGAKQAVHSQQKKLGQNALAWMIFIGIVALFIGFILAFTG